jgi:hypothetical protein
MKQPTSPPCPVCGNRFAVKVSEKPGSGIHKHPPTVKQIYRCRCGNAFQHVTRATVEIERTAGQN